MAHPTLTSYRALAWLAHRLPYPASKLAASVAGRRGAATRWERWAAGRTPRPLVWIHGASVGELLAATPVADRLERAVPGVEIVYSHSSPSAHGWPLSGAAHVDYVPLDEPAPVRRVLGALEPVLLLYSAGDVWPELTTQAADAGVPIAVCGARARSGTVRATAVGRALYGPVYRRLAWVGARSDHDADRWRRAGVPPERIEVTGDPRHDHVAERVPRPDTVAPLINWARGRTVLVAGSTHRPDDAVLLAAAREVLPSNPHAAVLVVPHEPTADRVARLLAGFGRAGIRAARWRPGDRAPQEAIVVAQSTGNLFDIYGTGALAFVGGGFGRGGAHAAIEPAAWGVPVITGPRARGDRDIALLARAGAAVVLPRRHPVRTLVRTWTAWLEDDRGHAAGLRARAILERGAAERTVAALTARLRFLRTSRSSAPRARR